MHNKTALEQFIAVSMLLVMLTLVSAVCLSSGCVPRSSASVSAEQVAIDDGFMALAVALTEKPKPKAAPPAPEIKEPEPVVKQEESKRHLYYFTADWCGPCERVKQSVIPPLKKSGWNKDWLTVIDIDINSELKRQYQIATIPAFVVVKNNKVIGRRVGYVDHVTLAKWANSLE